MIATWREIERHLLDYLHSQNVPLADGGGTAFLEAVLGEELTTWISLEDLARHLAGELSANSTFTEGGAMSVAFFTNAGRLSGNRGEEAPPNERSNANRKRSSANG
jgi:hypothetical protein